MQVRIDRVNRVLPEQITGIRVVRAFVRETGGDPLRDRQHRAHRRLLRAVPDVLDVRHRPAHQPGGRGDHLARRRPHRRWQLDVGSMIAYLTYLTQILWSVVLATFMVSMIPRASVAAAHPGGPRHPAVGPGGRPPRAGPAGPGSPRAARRRVPLPGGRASVLCDISFTGRYGTTTAVVGSTGAGRRPRPPAPALRRHVGFGARRQRGRARPGPGGADRGHLPGAAAAVPPRARWPRTCSTASPTPPRPRCGPLNRRRPRTSCGPCPVGSRPPSSRAAPVSGGQRQRLSGAWALVRRPGDLSSTARSRPSTWPPTPASGRPWPRTRRDAAVVIVAQRVSTIMSADQIVVLDDGDLVGLAPTTSSGRLPTYAEIVESQLGEGRPREHDGDQGRTTSSPRPAGPAGPTRVLVASASPPSAPTTSEVRSAGCGRCWRQSAPGCCSSP